MNDELWITNRDGTLMLRVVRDDWLSADYRTASMPTDWPRSSSVCSAYAYAHARRLCLRPCQHTEAPRLRSWRGATSKEHLLLFSVRQAENLQDDAGPFDPVNKS